MKLLLISLGCDKNLVDSEKMLGALTAGGYELTDDEQEAEIAVINTCCFIEDAKKESIETIFELTPYKEAGTLKAIVVTGCMAQRYREEIEAEIPEVDAIVGTTGYDEIVAACDAALSGRHTAVVKDASTDPAMKEKRVVTTGGFFAYLKIAEGCDKHCTYCAIPKMRGSYRSFPMEELLAEARDLADRGVRELILVAQETTLYGTDLYGRKCLHELVHELAQIKQIRWIRVMYCYPEEIYDGLIACMKEEPKLVHYLDLPIQHSNDSVLRRMGRRTSEHDLRAIIRKLRREIPDIILRTTLITGFP
jgi:ribosomal protein S12 methylthiotransferase